MPALTVIAKDSPLSPSKVICTTSAIVRKLEEV
jgi:hypothetical protein